MLRDEEVGLESISNELRVPEEELTRLVFGLVTIGLPVKDNIKLQQGSVKSPEPRVI